MNRLVAHVDMDAFFAAIEERDNPRLAGQPIVIGADPQGGVGRGVVSTANYAARPYGIRSGQPIRQAWQLAEQARLQGQPAAVFLPGSWRRYSQVSERIMNLIRTAAPIMQQRSVDEAYADISFTGSLEGARRWAVGIKKAILAAERLTASVGVGPNKLVAKIASDKDKPDGLMVVSEGEAADWLAPLPVRAIPGVGPKTGEILARRGIVTIADIRKFSEEELIGWLGKWGASLWRKAWGEDDVQVIEEGVRKSIGAQRTFARDVASAGVIVEKVSGLAEEVFSQLIDEGWQGAKTVTVIVRFHDFTTISSAHTLSGPATSARQVRQEALRLCLPFLDSRRNPRHKRIRLVGVRLEKLV